MRTLSFIANIIIAALFSIAGAISIFFFILNRDTSPNSKYDHDATVIAIIIYITTLINIFGLTITQNNQNTLTRLLDRIKVKRNRKIVNQTKQIAYFFNIVVFLVLLNELEIFNKDIEFSFPLDAFNILKFSLPIINIIGIACGDQSSAPDIEVKKK